MYTSLNSSIIPTVDSLLSMGVNVTIYNGQLDLICCTQGELAYPHIMLTKRMMLGIVYVKSCLVFTTSIEASQELEYFSEIHNHSLLVVLLSCFIVSHDLVCARGETYMYILNSTSYQLCYHLYTYLSVG